MARAFTADLWFIDHLTGWDALCFSYFAMNTRSRCLSSRGVPAVALINIISRAP
jgi:hypothetical protein